MLTESTMCPTDSPASSLPDSRVNRHTGHRGNSLCQMVNMEVEQKYGNLNLKAIKTYQDGATLILATCVCPLKVD